MKKYKLQIIGAISIIIAACFWSLDGILFRPKFYTFPALNVVFAEHLLGALLLFPFIILGWQKILKLTKSDFFSLLWVSLLGSLIGTLAITKGYFGAFEGKTTIATIVILQKLQPIFALVLASILLKEKLKKSFYIWAFISIISAYFLAFSSLGKDIFSIKLFSIPAFYAFIAAFAFGSSTVFGKNLVNNLGFQLTTSLRFLLTFILSFFALVIFGDFGVYNFFLPIHYTTLIIIAFTSGAGALFLYYFGLKKLKASQATILELAWPISAIFFDYYINGTILNITQIIASIVIIFCFFMIIKSKK